MQYGVIRELSFSGREFNYGLEYFGACTFPCINFHEVVKMLLLYTEVLED
jgi:hypothetical protein